jgi:hypothetical protein
MMLASAFAVLMANGALAEQVTIFGIGASSCAFWLSTPARTNEGIAWLMGYWTGVNSMNQTTHLIGANSDGEAIIAEVRKRCVAEPSARMTDAVAATYDYFSARGK